MQRFFKPNQHSGANKMHGNAGTSPFKLVGPERDIILKIAQATKRRLSGDEMRLIGTQIETMSPEFKKNLIGILREGDRRFPGVFSKTAIKGILVKLGQEERATVNPEAQIQRKEPEQQQRRIAEIPKQMRMVSGPEGKKDFTAADLQLITSIIGPTNTGLFNEKLIEPAGKAFEAIEKQGYFNFLLGHLEDRANNSTSPEIKAGAERVLQKLELWYHAPRSKY